MKRTSLHPRRLVRGLAISLVVLLVMLLITEVSVRLFTDTMRPLLVVDPVLGRRYERSFEGTVFNPESGREVNVRFNERGFRFPDLPFEKPAGTRRVVVLGDSMIAGMEMDVELIAASLLQEKLNDEADGDERWEVLNFGVSGASTAQEYVLYRELASRYQADLVLCVFFVGNDFGDNSRRLTNRTRIYFDVDDEGGLVQLPFPSTKIRFNELLNRYCYLYTWQKEKLENARRKLRAPAADAPLLDAGKAAHGDQVRASEWIFFTGEKEDCDHAWAVTRGAVMGMASVAEASGSQFALALLPSSLQVNDEEFAYLLEVADELEEEFDPLHPNRQLQAICDEAGVAFFDLLPGFHEAVPSRSKLVEDEWVFLNGSGHFNEQGNVLMARLLAERISELTRN